MHFSEALYSQLKKKQDVVIQHCDHITMLLVCFLYSILFSMKTVLFPNIPLMQLGSS
ncbi:unnamed protein product [Musa acuminata subsp. malaccensis]|uniref:(wild Malaysian banana) hypothetical protein n=1 Tax=Musa acuminata subsp. malaccensis TaxID=214687 RepID=A0A804KBU9_MUSAM|nr:unnamed protein product [Musa acuminata subsp. malaccensis]